MTSPATPSTCRLVARIRSPGQPRSSASTMHRARVRQVLALVEHEQHLPGLQVIRQRRHRPPRRPIRQSQRPGHLVHQQPGIPQPRQLRQPHPVPERPPRPRPPPAAPAASCRSSRPGQRDQPGALQRVTDPGKLRPAARRTRSAHRAALQPTFQHPSYPDTHAKPPGHGRQWTQLSGRLAYRADGPRPQSARPSVRRTWPTRSDRGSNAIAVSSGIASRGAAPGTKLNW